MPTHPTPPPSARSRPPGAAWLESHWNGLPNNEWVAADSSGLVAHDPSFDDVLAKVRLLQRDPADVTFAFVTFDTLQ